MRKPLRETYDEPGLFGTIVIITCVGAVVFLALP